MVSLIFYAALFFCASADDLSEIFIEPAGEKVSEATGGLVLLTCKYAVDVISDVAWYDNNENKIVDGEDSKKSLDSSPGQILLEMEGVTVDDAGIYRCKGMKTTGNVTTEVIASKNVAIFVAISFGNTSGDQDFLIGNDVAVVCNVEGTPVPSVSWEKMNEKGDYEKIDTSLGEKYLTLDGTNNLGIRNISKADEGKYQCKARQQSIGKGSAKDIIVSVNILPKIQNWVPSYTAIAGEQMTLTCEATGDPEPTYSWHRADRRIEDSTSLSSSNVLTLNVTADMNGVMYTCVAKNKAGNDKNDTMLTVNVKPYFDIAEGEETEEGESATIRCNARGSPTPVVKIYRNDILMNETTVPPTEEDSTVMDDNRTLPDGGWSGPNYEVIYNGNEATINFSSAKPEDAGVYQCRAQNDAGFESVDLELEVQYAPFPATMENKWACDDGSSVAQLDCEFNANPPANLSWSRMVQAEGSDVENDTVFVNLTESELPPGYDLRYTGNILSVLIDLSIVVNPWGPYSCFAENDMGDAEKTVYLRKAVLPKAPLAAQVKDVGTTTVKVVFEVLQPLVPYEMFNISLSPANPNVTRQSVNLAPNGLDSEYEYKFDDLVHNTQYTATIESVNCKGASEPAIAPAFRTKAIARPDAVTIVSGKLSEAHDEYTVQWQAGSLGGGEIAKILITLYKVEEKIDGQNLTKIGEFRVPSENLANENGSFPIDNLDPQTTYEISVEIYNEVGSAKSRTTFMTQTKPSEPDVTTTTETDIDVATGSVDGKLIGIIVGVLVLLILIVDLICCCCRDWGLSYWVYAHTCKRGDKHAVADMEEGSAKFSQEGEPSPCAANAMVEEEKQPLADQAEPVANGDPNLNKLDPIDEQTPLQKDEAVAASGNGSADDAKDQGQEEAEEKEEKNDEENLVNKGAAVA